LGGKARAVLDIDKAAVLKLVRERLSGYQQELRSRDTSTGTSRRAPVGAGVEVEGGTGPAAGGDDGLDDGLFSTLDELEAEAGSQQLDEVDTYIRAAKEPRTPAR
ncbi:hypothetical protein CLOP_g2680, partial [Closterium sp. NIES-67]